MNWSLILWCAATGALCGLLSGALCLWLGFIVGAKMGVIRARALDAMKEVQQAQKPRATWGKPKNVKVSDE